MNFERKTSQKQFLPILSEPQDQKLEQICQKFSSWTGGNFHHGHSEPDTFVNSFCAME